NASVRRPPSPAASSATARRSRSAGSVITPPPTPGGSSAEHPAEHVREESAVAVVLDVVGGIDPRDRLELARTTVLRRDAHGERLAGREAAGDPGHLVGLAARQPERGGVLAAPELERQDAHADEIAPVNALVALGDHGADA